MQGQAGRVLPGSNQEIRTVSGSSPSRACSLQLGVPTDTIPLPHRQLPCSTNEPLGANSSQADETTCRECRKRGSSLSPGEQGPLSVIAIAMRCLPGSRNQFPPTCALSVYSKAMPTMESSRRAWYHLLGAEAFPRGLQVTVLPVVSCLPYACGQKLSFPWTLPHNVNRPSADDFVLAADLLLYLPFVNESWCCLTVELWPLKSLSRPTFRVSLEEVIGVLPNSFSEQAIFYLPKTLGISCCQSKTTGLGSL